MIATARAIVAIVNSRTRMDAVEAPGIGTTVSDRRSTSAWVWASPRRRRLAALSWITTASWIGDDWADRGHSVRHRSVAASVRQPRLAARRWDPTLPSQADYSAPLRVPTRTAAGARGMASRCNGDPASFAEA